MQGTKRNFALINLPFFILPFFLFVSVVTNSIGFYLILFLYLFFLTFKLKIKIPYYFTQISVALFVMYICYSIANIMNFYFPNPNTSLVLLKKYVPFTDLLKSRLPTQYLSVSILFVGLYVLSKIESKNNINSVLTTHNIYKKLKPLETFLKGLFYAGIVFFIFFACESFFQIDYRSSLKAFSIIQRPIVSELPFARPTGFLANSLTLSSMALACFSFLYTYYFRLRFFQTIHDSAVPFFQNYKSQNIYLLISSFVFLGILFLTLSRTSIAIALLLLFFVPILVSSKRKKVNAIIIALVFAFIGLVACYCIGYIERLINSLDQIRASGHVDNRGIFRQIYWQMFLDHPWFGNGSYWISHGLRDQYFVDLGYATLEERNYPAHNVYLELLASGGIFCFTILIWGFWKIQKILKTFVMTNKNRNRVLWIALVVSILANMLHGLTQNNFLESSTTYTYFYIIVLIIWQNLFNLQKNSD